MADLSQLSDAELLALQDRLNEAEGAQNATAASHGAPPEKIDYAAQGARAAGLTARAGINGVLGVPGLVMDAGVASRNLIGDAFHKATGQPATPDYTLPFSQDAQASLDALGLPRPQSTGERIASVPLEMAAGGKMPIPDMAGIKPQVTLPGMDSPIMKASPVAPTDFTPAATSRAQVTAQLLKDNQARGFKVPPSTTNPNLGNRTIESVAGKENVQNFARIDNDAARTAVGARAIGLNPDVFTAGAVKATKEEAGQAWEAGRAVPQFKTDDQYLNDLIAVGKEGEGANESFPGAANPDVAKVIDTYTQPSMTGNAAVSAVKLLRGKASDAFNSGNGELGRTYKGIAQAIENQFERAIQNPAMGVKPTLVKDIKAARQRYAVSSLLEDSMLPDGTVSGPKLAAAWRNDEPITGELRDAAEFAAQYPKANLGASASGSPVNHLSTVGAILGAGLGEHLASGSGHGTLGTIAGVAAVPLARTAARAAMLSRWGQARALPAAAAAAGPQSIKPQMIAAALANWQPQPKKKAAQ